MSFSQDLIDKIYNYKTISNRIKIDRLLEIDVIQYTNLGLDSTKKEKDIVKKQMKLLPVSLVENKIIGRNYKMDTFKAGDTIQLDGMK